MPDLCLQVWHQIFDKVNWCTLIFGTFTGEHALSWGSMHPPLALPHPGEGPAEEGMSDV